VLAAVVSRTSKHCALPHAHCISHRFLYNGHLHVRGMESLRMKGLYNIKTLLVTSIMIPSAFGKRLASDNY
jgi:hypothetical protein